MNASNPNLAERIGRLTDNLEGLHEQLKASIARAVSSAVADAVRDAVASLLGVESEESPRDRAHFNPPGLFRREPSPWREVQDDPWYAGDHLPQEEEEPSPPLERPRRGQVALAAAVQAGLWWLRRQPRTRPLLTAGLV